MKYKAILKWDKGFYQEWESDDKYRVVLSLISKCDFLSHTLNYKYEEISFKVIRIDESNNTKLDLTELIFPQGGIISRLMKHRRKRKEEI